MRLLPINWTLLLSVVATSVAIALGSIPSALAQCDNDQLFDFVVAHDTAFTDTIARTHLSAVIRLDLESDSCVSVYEVGEFMLNASRILLPNWCRDSVRVMWDMPTLNANNYSESFQLSTGANIHFVREFGWYDPTAHPDSFPQTYTNFHSLDTIDCIVELVHSSGTRLALLDSMGVLRRTTRGAPIYYGTGAIIRSVNYTVPQSMNGETAFIRVRAFARGDGGYNFRRVDKIGIQLADKIIDSVDIPYIATFGGTIPVKPLYLSDLVGKEFDDNLTVDISGPLATVRFYTPSDVASVAVAVYRANGDFVVMPAATVAEPLSWSETRFRAESAGHYIIALFYDGVPVASKKVIILE